MKLVARQTIAAIIEVWNGAPTDRLAPLLASNYRGHTLGVSKGERDRDGYANAIEGYREANPGVVFHIVEQFDAGDRCVTRLEARRPSAPTRASSTSHGVNIARFDDVGLLSEEWAIWSPWLDDESPRVT